MESKGQDPVGTENIVVLYSQEVMNIACLDGFL